MRKICVLHVVGKMDMGGTETLIMNILRSYDRSKYKMEVLVHDTSDSFFDDELNQLGIAVHYIKKFNGKNLFSYIHDLHSFYRKNKFDIVHGHLSSSASIYLGIAKKYNMKTIAHSHSIYSFSFHSILHKILTFSTRYISDYFCAPTKAAGVDRYGKKITNSEKFFLVKNGFFMDKYLFDTDVRNLIRRSLNIKENEKIAIHIGRFTNSKNHIKLLRVFQNMISEGQNLKLLLIGAGELESNINSYIIENHLEEKVDVLGLRRDIPQLLMASDVFVFPSLNEGLGIALIEAQATGLPCVISDRIPQEAVLNKKSVEILSLSDNDSDWSRIVRDSIEIPINRKIGFLEVKRAGYDIADVVENLQRYYFDILQGD